MEYIISDSYDGYTRTLYKRICEVCSTEMWVPQHVDKKYCSRACTNKGRTNQVEVECDYCHILHKRSQSRLYISKTGLRFCSRECKETSQRLGGEFNKALLPHTKDGSTGTYREYALRTYGAKCSQCGYCETKKMLDVDHIDSNRKNNDISNLQVLCVWCHALKTRKVPPHERFRLHSMHL